MTSGSESPEQSAETPSTAHLGTASLAEVVREALDKTGHGWLRCVAVVVEDGVIILRGKVPSYYLKQLAQAIVMGIAGVRLLRNELRVEGGDQ
jgi:osmotically-inducible protein OsmY